MAFSRRSTKKQHWHAISTLPSLMDMHSGKKSSRHWAMPGRLAMRIVVFVVLWYDFTVSPLRVAELSLTIILEITLLYRSHHLWNFSIFHCDKVRVALIESLLSAWHYTKHFMHLISFPPHNNSLRSILTCILQVRRPGKFKKLPKSTHLQRDRARIQSKVFMNLLLVLLTA